MCVFKAPPLAQVAQTSGGAPSLEVFRAGWVELGATCKVSVAGGSEMSSEGPFSPEHSEFL